MLGVVVSAATTGCAAPPRQPAGPALPPVSAVAPPQSDITASRTSQAPDNPPPATGTSDTAPAVASITPPTPPPAAEPEPVPTTPARRPPDAVARRLAAELIAAAGDRGGPARIGVTQIRNYSRRSPSDFAAMTERLAGLLNDAARFDAGGARPSELPLFTADPADGVSHQIGGTAYLRLAGGVELWELYLTLSPADADFTVWEAATPIALRRAPGFQGPQLLAPPSDARVDADDDDG